MLIVLFLFGYNLPEPTGCVIDQCEKSICVVETPEGWVEVPKKPYYYEGKEVACPMWRIEPTFK